MPTFLKLGNIRIPREASALANLCYDAGARAQVSRYEISQTPLDSSYMSEQERLFSEIAAPLLEEKAFGLVEVLGHKGPALLFFRDVEEHNDDWEKYWVRSKGYFAPYFLHVILKGGGTILAAGKKEPVRRGDVFLLNPNVRHAYLHGIGDVCASYCLVVARPRQIGMQAKQEV